LYHYSKSIDFFLLNYTIQSAPKARIFTIIFPFYADWHRSANSHVLALKPDQENDKKKGIPGWLYTLPNMVNLFRIVHHTCRQMTCLRHRKKNLFNLCVEIILGVQCRHLMYRKLKALSLPCQYLETNQLKMCT